MPTYIQNQPENRPTLKQKEVPVRQKDDVPTQIGFALDASGSMGTIASEAVSGFNALVREQRKPGAPAAGFTLVLFHDVVRVPYSAVPITEVPLLNTDFYRPEGSTALNDAIGNLILDISKRTTRSTKVLLAILTDGVENASHQFLLGDIERMVSYRRTNYDWQFIFIGPREAASYARQIGIPESNIIDFGAHDIDSILERLSKSIRAYQLGERHYMLSLTSGNS